MFTYRKTQSKIAIIWVLPDAVYSIRVTTWLRQDGHVTIVGSGPTCGDTTKAAEIKANIFLVFM